MPPQQARVRARGVQKARIDDRAGKQRRLLRSERRRRLMKVGLRRSLRAVDTVAPLDHIQIQLEDTRLLQLRLEPPRDDQLAELSQRIF